MMKNYLLSVLLLLGFSFAFAQYSMEDKIYDYVDEYKDMAMQEMELYRVPASITLAQAIYASTAGTNDLAVKANNHFGIMCHTKEWTGATYYRGAEQTSNNCFRKYASAAESYRDHSLFLSQRSRYNKLFYFPITDYKSWAQGLKEAGYSINPHYADTLIFIIEKYYLMHYDRKVAQKIGDTVALRSMSEPKPERVTESPQSVAKPQPTPEPKSEPITTTNVAPTPSQTAEESTPEPKVEAPKSEQPRIPDESKTEQPKVTESANAPAPSKVGGRNIFTLDPYNVPYKQAYYPYTSRPVYENNKTKFIIAKTGDTYKSLAAALQLNEKNLRLFNDVYDESEPIEDEVVYVEMKSTKSPVEYHKLATGDTYRYIAQRYAVQLKILIKRNSGSLNNYDVNDDICIGCK